jgi:methyl-accepting chemotaxis protein
VLGRLSVAGRVWLASVAVALPITGMTLYLLVTGVHKDIAFAEQELAGNRYQRALELLLEQMAGHAQIAAQMAQQATPDLLAQLTTSETAISAALDGVDAAQTRDGERLQFTDEGLAARKRERVAPRAVRARWQQLVATNRMDLEKHQELLNDVRTMITHAGDVSNLILDPDLDSYYTMDITLLAVPQTQHRLAKMVMQNLKAIDDPGAQLADLRAMAIGAALLQESDLDRISADVDTALSEDANFSGTSESLQKNLRPAFDHYAEATKAFIALTQQAAAQADAQAQQAQRGSAVTGAVYAEAGARAQAASAAFWRAAVGELDVLLQARVNGLNSKLYTSLLITLFALVGSSALVLLIVRSITGPLNRVNAALSNGASMVGSASSEIAELANGLANGAQTHVRSLERTSGTVSGIANLAAENAARSRDAHETMLGLGKQVNQSQQMLDEIVRSMGTLKESSDAISRIIQTIDGVALQTNLLALNAAVEAARAGEAGAGFAVVAEEVRTLAQRSAEAARETDTLINESRTRATESVDAVARMVSAVSSVVDQLDRLTSLVDAISKASDDQAAGVREVVEHISQMERGVQDTSATAEHSAAASEELSEQANSTRALVADLHVAIYGNNAARAPESAGGEPPDAEAPTHPPARSSARQRAA